MCRSITEDLSETVVDVFIVGEAHTSDIGNYQSSTSPSLYSAMQEELMHLQKWIQAAQQ